MKKLGCKVIFDNSTTGRYQMKQYNYLTDIENLKEGDLVVVHARDDFELARFVCYDNSVEEKEITKWIISKVDLSMHYARIARKEKMKAIKEKLEAERKKTEELQIYEILAAANPEIRKLLDELKELQ